MGGASRHIGHVSSSSAPLEGSGCTEPALEKLEARTTTSATASGCMEATSTAGSGSTEALKTAAEELSVVGLVGGEELTMERLMAARAKRVLEKYINAEVVKQFKGWIYLLIPCMGFWKMDMKCGAIHDEVAKAGEMQFITNQSRYHLLHLIQKQ
jgi:hypothetical protein